MKKRASRLLILGVVFGILFAGCSPKESAGGSAQAQAQPDKVYTIKFASVGASMDPEKTSDVLWYNVFRDYVAEKSGGRLKADFYGSGQLGGQAESAQGVAGGSVEMAIINLAVLTGFDKNLMIFTIPGLFANEQECTDILNSPFGKQMLANVEKQMNFKVSGVACNGFRSFTNSRREVKRVGDIKGLVIRTMQDPVYIAMVEALGAKAVPMPSSDMYVAMQNKVVDGQENPIINIFQDLTYEVQKYFVLDNHTASVMLAVISSSWLASLPADLQDIVMQGSAVGGEAAYKLTQKLNAEGIEALRKEGMIVYEPTPTELAEWHSVIYPATVSFVKNQTGDEPVNNLEAEIKAYRANKK